MGVLHEGPAEPLRERARASGGRVLGRFHIQMRHGPHVLMAAPLRAMRVEYEVYLVCTNLVHLGVRSPVNTPKRGPTWRVARRVDAENN